MSEPVLTTKLHIPLPRPALVHRKHLLDKLTKGLKKKLTLISAPAGFGKTTLVSDWIETVNPSVTWLSLEEADGDLSRFMSYLILAVQKIHPNAGEDASRLLENQHVEIESILSSLLNDLSACPDRCMIVLDDYHRIDSKEVDAALTFFLDHQPTNVHIIFVTREDPTLPLARLRARADMSEIRESDLRFNTSEIQEFLHRVMEIRLDNSAIASLEQRTEGWVAGLQLAALSMHGRSDKNSFVDSFAGDDRYIIDYLIEEVLIHRSLEQKQFLEQTCILDSFSAPLCDAVRNKTDSESIIQNLDRDNLFIIPLDNKREWFRYHHLFADALRAHRKKLSAEDGRKLHLKASEWYQSQESHSEAIQHAISAEDSDRAADLLELVWPTMYSQYRMQDWLAWVRKLPESVCQTRPVLSMCHAEALMAIGELERSKLWVDKTESAYNSYEDSDREQTSIKIADQQQYELLPFSIPFVRSYLAKTTGDIPNTIRYAKQAQEHISPDDHTSYLKSTALLSVAQWETGDLIAADQALVNLRQRLVDNAIFEEAIGLTFMNAEIKCGLGCLTDAFNVYQDALNLSKALNAETSNGLEDLHLGLSQVYAERGAWDQAWSAFDIGESLKDKPGLPGGWIYRLRTCEAFLRQASGDLPGALKLLRVAEDEFVRTPLPEVRPIHALIARNLALQGNLDLVRKWSFQRKLSCNDDLDYLNEFEYITYAKYLTLEYSEKLDGTKLEDAISLLKRMLVIADSEKRSGSVLDISIQLSMAQAASGDEETARSTLIKALKLAEPEGYLSIFLIEGLALKRLLLEVPDSHPCSTYAQHILVQFSDSGTTRTRSRFATKVDITTDPAPSLSKREREVLQLVAQGFSNAEIAQKLFVSVSTIKSHNLKIFEKLSVKRRTEAVAKAGELNLI